MVVGQPLLSYSLYMKRMKKLDGRITVLAHGSQQQRRGRSRAELLPIFYFDFGPGPRPPTPSSSKRADFPNALDSPVPSLAELSASTQARKERRRPPCNPAAERRGASAAALFPLMLALGCGGDPSHASLTLSECSTSLRGRIGLGDRLSYSGLMEGRAGMDLYLLF
ncbi:hypothetical protein GOP47_0013948 [Adiantum capillus-veneris]|uniref:Uncharacterized protein n=1 Tax=Adiantum capillus-veneris TaxID=13818 RepID=A0A9D4UQG5_ADICA|nr:hypothetical protein GOP47_0013948 [Adiantum capillus-veneris]